MFNACTEVDRPLMSNHRAAWREFIWANVSAFSSGFPAPKAALPAFLREPIRSAFCMF